MRIHKSGDKSVAYFTAYMQLILQANITSIENLEKYMAQHFFQNDIASLGPNTLSNFNQALQIIIRNEV